MAESKIYKNFYSVVGVKALSISADTETVITDDITISQSGLYLVSLVLGGIDAAINRSIKIYRRNDNYIVLATYLGEYGYMARVVDLYQGNKIYATIKTSNNLMLYADARYNSFSVIQIA